MISPEKLVEKTKKHFDETDKHIFITTFIIGIITNFYFFISNGLSPDALSDTNTHVAGLWELQLGRFSLNFLDNVRFGFVNQLLIVLIALFFMSIGIMLIRRIFKIENKLILTIMCFTIAVAPQFTETYMYLYCADSYLLAFASAAFAVFSLSRIRTVKEDKKWVVFAILATVLTSSLYQAYLGVLAGLLVIYAIKETIDSDAKTAIKHFIRNAFIIGIGIGFYYVIFRVLCKLNHTRPASYKGANNLGIGTLLALPETIKGCFEDLYYFFFNDGRIINNAYYHRCIFYVILLVSFILSTFSIFKSEKKNRVSKIITTSLLILIFPIAVNIMNVVAAGTRINLVTGPGILTTVVLFLVFIDYLKDTTFNIIIKYVSYIVLIFISATFMVADIRTYIAREKQYNDFKVIAENIYTQATLLEDYDPNMEYLFSYVIKTPASEIEKTTGMVTKNTISWTGYAGVKRYQMFYSKFLGKNIVSADEEKYEKIIPTEEFEKMSVYPENGSIKIIDNTIVVKVSEDTFIKEDGKVRLW